MIRTTRTMMNRGQIETVRTKASENARELLNKLGFRGVDYGDRLVGCCPVPHNGAKSPNDNRSAFNWLFDRGIWRCFSNHCEQQYGADIFGLIRSTKRYHGRNGFQQAVEWACRALSVNPEEVEEVSEDQLNEMRRVLKRRMELKRHTAMEEEMMAHLTPCDYLIRQRHFDRDTVDEFKANGSWHRIGTYGYNRLIIPLHDPLDGYLIGFTCRTLMTPQQLAKYNKKIGKWVHCRNFAQQWVDSKARADEDRIYAAHILFNLHRAKEHMGIPKTLILVEGPLDVMRLWEAGIKNGIAVLGVNISPQQKQLLHMVGAQRLVGCFDADEAGEKAYERLVKTAGKYFQIERVIIPDVKDIGDMDALQVRHLFRKYV